jgi:hypothetical protein
MKWENSVTWNRPRFTRSKENFGVNTRRCVLNLLYKNCGILYVHRVQYEYMQCNWLICRECLVISRENVVHYQVECGKRHMAVTVTYLHVLGLHIKFISLQLLS